jgi:chemotaxis protein CheD
MLETLVGSCVAVCLYNRKTGEAAMNHFLMHGSPHSPQEDFAKYGVTATEHIIREMFKLDPASGHYVAQIFGGAAVVRTTSTEPGIGELNVADARETLARHHIAIAREEVGGARGRRIQFDTSTNTVFCRFAGQVGRKYRQKAQDQ